MEQPNIFDQPTEPTAPFQGASPLAIAASKSGARHATQARSANITMLRQLWREPRTMQDIAAITKLPLSSVCSLKAELEDELIEVDHEVVQWGEGRKTTYRTRWQLRQNG